MADATVFDANCWCAYVDENLNNSSGLAAAAFAKAQAAGSILLDAGKLIEQQYRQARRGFGEKLFEAFFNDGVVFGKVKLVAPATGTQIRKELLALGVPSGEHIYFRTAISGTAEYIVSEDIDFFDPSLKKSTEAVKTAAKTSSSGCVCKHFSKTHSISIVCLQTY